jgi:hypothetical protein
MSNRLFRVSGCNNEESRLLRKALYRLFHRSRLRSGDLPANIPRADIQLHVAPPRYLLSATYTRLSFALRLLRTETALFVLRSLTAFIYEENNFEKNVNLKLSSCYKLYRLLCKAEEHCLLGCFHDRINYKCILGLCTVWLYFEPTFQRMCHLYLQNSSE